eukprot:CAMPEP_0201128212 /NCGR_PEP_ID=MMETSP0850-20130426/32965_1 /ASSEMBLY_ACC=CAM_ASM_000622 /TAXON_ID=183588 /ORGANISM="Pseudo-nitzschia fraudulenta, Strain WWA7" /LENGTH=259 /DNA_ID=CAMNT_0047397305 /DNA_START=433 /DNA_END=1212 /DNA_ORIENTATION=-
MTSHLHPSEWINETNGLIFTGEYDKAITTLTILLQHLKSVLSRESRYSIPVGSQDDGKEDEYTGENESSPDGFKFSFSSSVNSSSFYCITITNIAYDTQEQGKIQCTIFRDPFMVNGDGFQEKMDRKACEEISYVTIYNLALAHHLKSLEPALASAPELRRSYLQKALLLYEHSYLIQMEQMVTIGIRVIHSMALVSSIRHICLELGDSRRAEICKQYLVSTLMNTICRGEVNTLGEYSDGFFNMIIPFVYQVITAPAA